MNDNIIISCEEFIEKRISTKFLSKGKEIDWQFIRNFNYKNLDEILYLIFNYPHKHYTFKHFEV